MIRVGRRALSNTSIAEANNFNATIGSISAVDANTADNHTYKADLVLENGIPGLTNRPTACDMTVTCNFNKTMVKRSAKDELAAAMSGETRKDKELKDRCDSANYDFVPLSFEAMGGHSETILPLAHYLVTQKSFMKNIPFNEASSHFWQELSVTLQKVNARAVFDRVQS